MKESKFIELLNLYVDGQLDPAEAVSLESEIQRDPVRRRIYGEYCRMQKACSVLAQKFMAEGAAEENSKVVVMPRQSRVWTPVFYATGLAAAACLAFVVVTRVNNRASGPQFAATMQSSTALSQMPTVSMPERAASQLVPVGKFTIAKTEAASLIPTGLKPSPNFALQPQLFQSTEPVQFAWMANVKLSPVNAEQPQSIFESRALQEENSRVFHNPRPVMTPVEMTAFQFQK